MENIQRKHAHKVSVIIPFKGYNEDVEKCLRECARLPEAPELIPVADALCPGLPAKKRNYGIVLARGDYIAFIDSDAYPTKGWLREAITRLRAYNDIVAVCGPGILPSESNIRQRATDLVLRWLPYSYRVVPKATQYVAEYPTFNLIVKAKYLKDIKFRSYLTGEDSLLCRELLKYGKILYSPYVVVYHHRRELFKPYFKQIATYGWHRGHLIGLALLGWLSTLIIYPRNFLRGFKNAFKKGVDK